MKYRFQLYAFACVVLAGFFPVSCHKDVAFVGKPNIVLILIDDLGYADMSACDYAAFDVNTPNIDRLAEEGILFTQAYAASCVCSPSRVGLFTGRYPHRWGGWKYRTGLPEDETTLSEYFSREGYVTGLIGKNDWGTGVITFSDRASPLQHGYSSFFGFSRLWHEYFITDQPLPEGDRAKEEPYGPLQYNSGYADLNEGYTTELFTDSAIVFMERHKKEPFLLVLSYNAVHDIVQQVPEKYLEKFKLKPIPNYQYGTEPYKVYYKRYSQVGEVSFDEMRRYYLANLACLDDQIGRLLDAMDQKGLHGNSLVIFMGDNGGSPQSGSVNYPLSGYKYLTMEGGIRVPLVIQWPEGFPSGKVCSHRISAYDILPTTLDAAGIQKPDHLDGESVLEALKDNSSEWPANYPLFFEFTDQYAVIQGDMKLVKSREIVHHYGGIDRMWPAAGETPRLFNLRQDRGEHVDLSSVQQGMVKELQQAYDQWHTEVHAEAEERFIEP